MASIAWMSLPSPPLHQKGGCYKGVTLCIDQATPMRSSLCKLWRKNGEKRKGRMLRDAQMPPLNWCHMVLGLHGAVHRCHRLGWQQLSPYFALRLRPSLTSLSGLNHSRPCRCSLQHISNLHPPLTKTSHAAPAPAPACYGAHAYTAW